VLDKTIVQIPANPLFDCQQSSQKKSPSLALWPCYSISVAVFISFSNN